LKKTVEKKSSRKSAVAKSEAAPVGAAEVQVTGDSKKKAARAVPKRVKNYKFHAKKELSAAFPAIVDVLVNRAKKGSLTHTKLLFDIGGVKDKPIRKESQQPHFSLAQVLLDEVAKLQEQGSEPVLTGTNVDG
jgi:hypothetical protein